MLHHSLAGWMSLTLTCLPCPPPGRTEPRLERRARRVAILAMVTRSLARLHANWGHRSGVFSQACHSRLNQSLVSVRRDRKRLKGDCGEIEVSGEIHL